MAVREYTTYISGRGTEFIILISHLHSNFTIHCQLLQIHNVYAKTSSPSFARVTYCGIFVLRGPPVATNPSL